MNEYYINVKDFNNNIIFVDWYKAKNKFNAINQMLKDYRKLGHDLEKITSIECLQDD